MPPAMRVVGGDDAVDLALVLGESCSKAVWAIVASHLPVWSPTSL